MSTQSLEQVIQTHLDATFPTSYPPAEGSHGPVMSFCVSVIVDVKTAEASEVATKLVEAFQPTLVHHESNKPDHVDLYWKIDKFAVDENEGDTCACMTVQMTTVVNVFALSSSVEAEMVW
jgi:hypothetical protein